MDKVPFVGFLKIARFSREVIVTEKIDGTNAQVYITDDGRILAGSRTRFLTLDSDNYGFAAWVTMHSEELRHLGPGRHFGEWWGQGIQRRYGLSEKRFSLFNVSRWGPRGIQEAQRPSCCGVVPTLWRGQFDDLALPVLLANLRAGGSIAAPGFMNPEGVMIYHVAAGICFKKTLERDDEPKGQQHA